MDRRNGKRLTLHRETLRNLQDGELRHVVGGTGSACACQADPFDPYRCDGAVVVTLTCVGCSVMELELVGPDGGFAPHGQAHNGG